MVKELDSDCCRTKLKTENNFFVIIHRTDGIVVKQIVEHRRDFEDKFEELSDEEYQKLDEFADSIWDYIEDFIEKNFTVIKIDDTFNISY